MNFQNPLLWSDYPDPDLIRVGDAYYMVTTTMFLIPGGPIMKSYDLVHWEIISYIFNEMDGYDLSTGRSAYARGQWATSLKYHNGMFYALFTCWDMQKTLLFTTPDIESGHWQRRTFDGVYHDVSLLFDDDKIYIIYNGGDIHMAQIKPDLSEVETASKHLLFSTRSEGMRLRCEGCRAYHVGGYYYLLFIEWPKDGVEGGRRREVCYRAKSLEGPYEYRIIADDDLGYRNQGIAQGALIDTPTGDWYIVLFQDRGAVGRIPYLFPVTWKDNWPVPNMKMSFELPFTPKGENTMLLSDSFDHAKNRLDPHWQWNHNPDNDRWSFTESPEYLRLKTGKAAQELFAARNTLTQRTCGPSCAFSVEADCTGMHPGDYAGVASFQWNYGMIGVKVGVDGSKKIVVSTCETHGVQQEVSSVPLTQKNIFLKTEFLFDCQPEIACFFYSLDGDVWLPLGPEVRIRYTTDLFIGTRAALFCYSETGDGGYADFRRFNAYILG